MRRINSVRRIHRLGINQKFRRIMWQINVELIQLSTCLEDVLRWFGERRINEEIGLRIAKRLGSSVLQTGITDSNFQFVRENTSTQKKHLWYPQVGCTNEAKRIFNHIHWDRLMTKSFTCWEIPADIFQFIWIQSNVLLLSSRNEQNKELIPGWLWPGWDRC